MTIIMTTLTPAVTIGLIKTSFWHWCSVICTVLTALFCRSFAFFTGTTESMCASAAMPSATGHLWLWIADEHFLCLSCIAQRAQTKEYQTGSQANISSWCSTFNTFCCSDKLQRCTKFFRWRNEQNQVFFIRINCSKVLKAHTRNNQLSHIDKQYNNWALTENQLSFYCCQLESLFTNCRSKYWRKCNPRNKQKNTDLRWAKSPAYVGSLGVFPVCESQRSATECQRI